MSRENFNYREGHSAYIYSSCRHLGSLYLYMSAFFKVKLYFASDVLSVCSLCYSNPPWKQGFKK